MTELHTFFEPTHLNVVIYISNSVSERKSNFVVSKLVKVCDELMIRFLRFLMVTD